MRALLQPARRPRPQRLARAGRRRLQLTQRPLHALARAAPPHAVNVDEEAKGGEWRDAAALGGQGRVKVLSVSRTKGPTDGASRESQTK